MILLARLPDYRCRYAKCCVPPDCYYHVSRHVWFAGDYIHFEAGVYARWMDGGLSCFVRISLVNVI